MHVVLQYNIASPFPLTPGNPAQLYRISWCKSTTISYISVCKSSLKGYTKRGSTDAVEPLFEHTLDCLFGLQNQVSFRITGYRLFIPEHRIIFNVRPHRRHVIIMLAVGITCFAGSMGSDGVVQ